MYYVVTYPVPKQPYKTLSILKLRRIGEEPGTSLVPYGGQVWLWADAGPPFFFFWHELIYSIS